MFVAMMFPSLLASMKHASVYNRNKEDGLLTARSLTRGVVSDVCSTDDSKVRLARGSRL